VISAACMISAGPGGRAPPRTAEPFEPYIELKPGAVTADATSRTVDWFVLWRMR